MPYNEAKQARDTIAGLCRTERRIWRSACEHDGIATDSLFAVFSEANPHVPFHDRVIRQLWEVMRYGVPGGGYVGLRIRGGRAIPHEMSRPSRGSHEDESPVG